MSVGQRVVDQNSSSGDHSLDMFSEYSTLIVVGKLWSACSDSAVRYHYTPLSCSSINGHTDLLFYVDC